MNMTQEAQLETHTQILSDFSFQLEEFNVLRLNVAYSMPPQDALMKLTQMRCNFDYDVAVHHTERHRYRLIFRTKIEEMSGEIQVGKIVEAEMLGFFRMLPDSTVEQRETRIRVNGVSILYGLLRGIVATTTGCFPMGKMVLPSVMPQDIVNAVETDK